MESHDAEKKIFVGYTSLWDVETGSIEHVHMANCGKLLTVGPMSRSVVQTRCLIACEKLEDAQKKRKSISFSMSGYCQHIGLHFLAMFSGLYHDFPCHVSHSKRL